MPKIVHISRKAFEQGLYANYPIAIRIADSFDQLTEVANPAQQSYAFAFLDVDECESDSISEADASLIVHTLMTAKANNEDVVVHCEAGISRSGAVAQFAIDVLGFEDEKAPDSVEGESWRLPNHCILNMLYKAHKFTMPFHKQNHCKYKSEYVWSELVQEAKRLGLEFPLSANGITILVNHVLAKNSNA